MDMDAAHVQEIVTDAQSLPASVAMESLRIVPLLADLHVAYTVQVYLYIHTYMYICTYICLYVYICIYCTYIYLYCTNNYKFVLYE